MIELVVMLACIVLMARVAEFENRSGVIWGSVTLVLCLACFSIPLPYVRVLIALVISYIALSVYNARQDP